MSRFHSWSLACTIFLCAFCASISATSPTTSVEEPGPRVLFPKSEFSISKLRVGMTRERVETIYGTGRPSGNVVSYGRTWDVGGYERDTLTVIYDKEGKVESVTGRELRHRGKPISFLESNSENDPSELEGFGPTDKVLMGALPSWRSTYIYRELGVEVLSCPAGLWYTISQGWIELPSEDGA